MTELLIKPMLLGTITSFDDLPRDPRQVVIEPKHDGYRIVAQVNLGMAARHAVNPYVTLMSRSGNDVTDRFPETARELIAGFGFSSGILDCEIVATDEMGRERLSVLHDSRVEQKFGVTLYPFDVLQVNDNRLTSQSLDQRKAALEVCLPADSTPHVSLVRPLIDPLDGISRLLDEGREGIVVKKRRSAYEAGVRRSHWMKFPFPGYRHA